MGGGPLNIPNVITALRFVLVPIFGYYLFTQQFIIAGILFIVGGITDVLDGYIARRFNMITSWGKLADPLADKLMQITALIILTYLNRIPISILIVVTAKESFMALGSISLYAKEKHIVSANWYGKLATVVFYFAVIGVILIGLEEPYSGLVVGIAVLPTLFAFFMYSLAYNKIKKDYQ